MATSLPSGVVHTVPSVFSAPSTPSFAAGAKHTALKYAAITSGAMLTGAADAAAEDGALAAVDAGAFVAALLEAVEAEPEEQAARPVMAAAARASEAVILKVEVMGEG